MKSPPLLSAFIGAASPKRKRRFAAALINRPRHRLSSSCDSAPMALALIPLLVLALSQPAGAVSMTWINPTGGSWPISANWAGGVIANGVDNTADFSTLDLATDATLTLDGARTIGNLIFGDATTPSNNWFLSTGTGDPLTLDLTAGSPTANVLNQIATISTVIAGSDGLTKTGAGTLLLNNPANTYTGNTVVSAGILQIATTANTNGATLGAPSVSGSSNLVFANSGATLQLMGNSRIADKELHISGTGVGGTLGAFYVDATGLTNGTRWGVSIANPALVLDGDATIRVDGNGFGPNTANLLIGRTNLNGFTITKTGTGRLSFDTVSGLTGDGTIRIAEGVLGIVQNQITGNRNLTIDPGAETRVGRGNDAINSTTNVVTVNGVLDVNARGNGTVGSDTTSFSHTIGVLLGNGTITTGRDGNVGVQTLNINSSISDSTFIGTITSANGTLNINKAGSNTLSLNGANSYNGTTTVIEGTVLVNGSHTSGGAYSVSAGATLGGRGSIGSAVDMSGTLSPGSSPGTLTISALNMLNGSIYSFEGGDLTAVTGQLDLDENWTLALGGGLVDGGSVTIFTYGTLATQPDLQPTFDTFNLGFTPSGPLSLTNTGNSILVNGVQIPEPATSTALVAGLAMLLTLPRFGRSRPASSAM